MFTIYRKNLARPTGMPGHALLGAIIEAKAGSIFVKFTGKKATVDGAAKDFRAMVTGAKE